MPAENTLALRVAVSMALRQRGTRLFERPGEFLGYVLDLADPDSEGSRALLYNCDDEFMDIFLQSAKRRTPQTITDAANRATLLLKEERMIQEDVARQVACEISFALSNHLRVACPESVRTIAVGRASGFAHGGASGKTSAWYEAQRARNDAPNVHEFGASAGRGNAGAGFARGGSSVPKSDVSSHATTTAAPPVSGSGPVGLSTDPVIRRNQIESTGLKMSWFVALTCICLAVAVLRLLGAGNYIVLLDECPPDSYRWRAYLYANLVMMVAFCVGYFLSWRGLRKFRKSGPRIFMGTFFLNTVYTLAAIAWQSSLSGLTSFASDGTYRSIYYASVWLPMSLTLLVIVVNLAMWTATWQYFEKRKQYFNLP